MAVTEAIALIPVSSFFFGLAGLIILIITITEPVWLPIFTLLIIFVGSMPFFIWVLMTWLA